MPRRRSKGQGAYWYDKKAKRHCYRITHEERTYTITDVDRNKAEAKLKDLKARLAADVKIGDSKQTLTTYLDYWLKDVIGNDLKNTTQADYTFKIQHYILPELGDYRLDRLTTRIIIAWKNAIYKEYALNSVAQSLNILKRALKHAVLERLIPANPADSVTSPRKARQAADTVATIGKVLTHEQVAALLTMARTPLVGRYGMELEALYTIATRYGPREAELLGLQWVDLDWKRGTLDITGQVQTVRGVGTSRSDTTKTDAGRRTMYLDTATLDLLRTVQTQQAARLAKSDGIASGLIFTTRSGKPIAARNLVHHFKSLLVRAELPDIRFHDLRVTAITHMREAGIDLEVIASLVGHSDPAVTAKVYSKVSEARAREALKKLRD